jgi:hypothetical protein
MHRTKITKKTKITHNHCSPAVVCEGGSVVDRPHVIFVILVFFVVGVGSWPDSAAE